MIGITLLIIFYVCYILAAFIATTNHNDKVTTCDIEGSGMQRSLHIGFATAAFISLGLFEFLHCWILTTDDSWTDRYSRRSATSFSFIGLVCLIVYGTTEINFF